VIFLFIVFEGIDRSGKTTQTEKTKKILRKLGKKFTFYKYPDRKGVFGDLITSFLKEKIDLSVTAQFLLFISDIAKDQEKIFKDLSSGKVVILDRYFYSAIAYQKLPYEKAINLVTTLNFLRPDLVIYLDISTEESMKRMKRKTNLERYEKNFERLLIARTKYRTMADSNLFGKWKVIDGSKSINEISSEIEKEIKKMLR
jgi:dTMP kinase